MKQTAKAIEDELKKIYRAQGENLVNNKKEWFNYVDTLDYKSTDILYTLICLQKLIESNATYDELYNFLYNLKPSVKKVNIECYVDFMQCSTYGDKTVSSGNFVIKKDLVMDISQKNVIVVEDILDSGYTIKNLLEYLKNKNPKTIKVATFIDKPARRAENVTADYVGVVMSEDHFIVGYGLDYAQKYRNLPYIGILKEEIYK